MQLFKTDWIYVISNDNNKICIFDNITKGSFLYLPGIKNLIL